MNKYESKVLQFFFYSLQTANHTRTSFPDDSPCFNQTSEDGSITRLECYRASLLTFLLILGPFVFFNVQKTKYLQIVTTLMRWLGKSITTH